MRKTAKAYMELLKEEKLLLLAAARETIRARVNHEKPDYGFIPGGQGSHVPGDLPETFTLYCGAFVTLHKESGLRGCIGNMTGIRPLVETVIEMAKSAAFEDPRFPAVTAEELPRLDIEISVLSPLRVIRRLEDIEIGVHGVYIRQGGASGVLLPQVATEQGWDRITFLEHTCKKAGLTGGCYKDPETEIQIFSAVIFGEKELKRA